MKRRFSGSREAGFEDRLGRRLPRTLAHLDNRGAWPRRFDAIPNHPLELHSFGRRLAIGRSVLTGLLVLEERRIELILRLELAGAREMENGRALHGSLERNLVLGALGIRLHGLGVVLHGRVPVVDAGCGRAATVSALGRAACSTERDQTQTSESHEPTTHLRSFQRRLEPCEIGQPAPERRIVWRPPPSR